MEGIELSQTDRQLLLYTITYNNYQRRYKMWEGSYLREDFGVFLKDGKLMRHMGFDLY